MLAYSPVEPVSIRVEFANSNLPDERLDRRLSRIGCAIATAPSQSFPQIAGSAADLEGLYRFLANPRVDFQDIVSSHIFQTARRANQAGQAIVVHDTTRFDLPYASSKEVGFVETGRSGFYGHFALAIQDEVERKPLGVVSLQTIHRPRRSSGKGSNARRGGRYALKWKDRESQRWFRGVEQAQERLQDCPEIIHVADREADSYALLGQLHLSHWRHVIRVRSDRRACEAEYPQLPWPHLWEVAARAEVVLARQVPLSVRNTPKKYKGKKPARTNPPRKARMAELHIAAVQVLLDRPDYLAAPLPPRLPVNLVYVFEPMPPPGEEAVEWLLFTSEPIDTEEQVARVVDIYRSRWTIEEFFKALKTGCLYQERQLESRRGLLNALAIFTPIAVQMLWLRAQAQSHGERPAEGVLTPVQIEVLRSFAPYQMPEALTARDALWAVAAMGGHIKSNGEPGWQTIGRGYRKLLDLTAGWSAALEGKM